MNVTEHKKAIVRVLLNSLMISEGALPSEAIAFAVNDLEEKDEHQQYSYCTATGLFFPDELCKNQITCSEYGDLWMGLWLGEPLRFNDVGFVVFPQWLAEVLNDVCNLKIAQKDVYTDG